MKYKLNPKPKPIAKTKTIRAQDFEGKTAEHYWYCSVEEILYSPEELAIRYEKGDKKELRCITDGKAMISDTLKNYEANYKLTEIVNE